MRYDTPLTPSDEPEKTSRAADAAAQATAMDVTAYLLAGPITFGGLGMLGDHFLHTAFLLPIGALGGLALALYLVWFRYGRSGQQ